MENSEVVIRLQKRGAYLQTKIDQLTQEGKPTFWFEKDAESIQIAIACVQYTQAMLEYEKSSALESSG